MDMLQNVKHIIVLYAVINYIHTRTTYSQMTSTNQMVVTTLSTIMPLSTCDNYKAKLQVISGYI